MRIRKVPTASGKHAVQVVSGPSGHLTLHQHIGTYATVPEKLRLYQKASDFIRETTRQSSLFDRLSTFRPADIAVSENRPLFVYRLLGGVYDKLGLNSHPDPLIRDLVVARIYSPASKRATREVLADSFGQSYSLLTIYRHLKTSLASGLKETFQTALINFAKSDLGDVLRLVFYDVTTLYFESGIKTNLKDFGFSKDHRPENTQVIVGLVVNRQGFPLYFDVFSGRLFEGHTFAQVVSNIRRLLNNPQLVVVADSAMISQKNIEVLMQMDIGFVVAARMANLPADLINHVAQTLARQDGLTTTVTYRGQRLICQYSTIRAAKDKSDRLRQIARAEKAITTPATLTNRYRFITKSHHQGYAINTRLVTKAEKLEGIKGYLTNTKLDEAAVIDRYHDLWRIETAFRLTKSDLQARPVFHRLDETIKAHLVIVFAGLAIAKYIEISTGMSIKKVLQLAGKVLTHKVTHTATGESAYVETTIEDPELKEKIEQIRIRLLDTK